MGKRVIAYSTHKCQCGCGNLVPQYYADKEAWFIHGHRKVLWGRLREDSADSDFTLPRCGCGCGNVVKAGGHFAAGHYLDDGRVYRDERGEVQPWLCACGCGEFIRITERSLLKYWSGNPPKFIRGHVARTPGGPKPPINRGPDSNRWKGGISGKKMLVIVPPVDDPYDNEKQCSCGCGWMTSLEAEIPDPVLVYGHHQFIVDHYEGDYSALHARLRDAYQKFGVCEKCKCKDKTEFSLIHGHKYTENRNDYRELCKKCHMKYDKPALKHISLDDQHEIINDYLLSMLYKQHRSLHGTTTGIAVKFGVTGSYVRKLARTTRIPSA